MPDINKNPNTGKSVLLQKDLIFSKMLKIYIYQYKILEWNPYLIDLLSYNSVLISKDQYIVRNFKLVTEPKETESDPNSAYQHSLV